MAIFYPGVDPAVYGTDNSETLTGLAQKDFIFAYGGDDIVNGGSAPDLVDGGAGNDILNGNGGDDLLDGGPGNDVLTGGNDADTVTYASALSGVRVSLANDGDQDTRGAGIDRLSGVENLVGSQYDDILSGDAGANTLEGGLGNDRLSGGAGADFASYSTASSAVHVDLSITIAQDTVGAGSDTLTRIEGLVGSDFDDALKGDAGRSTIYGGGGNDHIDGGDGYDILYGGAGDDLILGGAGIDRLYGEEGSDVLHGGTGADILFESGSGSNIIDGGENADILNLNFSDQTGDVVFIDGGVNGTTYAQVNGVVVDAITNVEIMNIVGGAGNDRIGGTYSWPEHSGFGLFATLDGGTGIDTAVINLSAFPITFSGSLAEGLVDTADDPPEFPGQIFSSFHFSNIERLDYTGSTGVTILDYDPVDPVTGITGGAYDDRLTGLSNNDVFYGAGGNDVITGNDGLDRLYGDDGSDILTGGAGEDRLAGGDGNDRLFSDGNDTVDGGAGIDTLNLDLSGATAGVIADLGAAFSGGNSTINGRAITGVEQYVQIVGSAFGDTINVGNASQGYDGELTYDGNPGVYGGDGNDTLTGGAATNYLFGGNGNDVLSAGGGNDYLDGGSGVDSLDGGDGSDYAYIDMGGTTGDIVFINGGVAGTAYIRTIDGVAAGSVTNVEAVGFIAGSGDDMLGIRQVVPSSSSFLAGAGDDTLVIDYGASAIAASTQADGVSILSTLDGSTATIQYDGFEHLQYTAGSGGGAISGFSGDDILVAGAGDDVFDGGAGFDTISFANATSAVRASLAIAGSQQTLAGYDMLTNIEGIIGSAFGDLLTGSNGDDVIDGGTGNDTIHAGGGNDLLIGGQGSDILDGGAGIDTVSFADDVAGVRISLALEGLQRTVGSANDTLIGIENLTGSAFDDRLAGDTGANVIDAGAGDDLVEGGAGDDILAGGIGVDTLTYANAEAGVNLSLSLTAIQSTIGAGSDIVSGFENLTGSAFADILSGDGSANRIDGGAGADHLDGAGGDDWLHGGLGDDVLTGGSGNDTASYDDAVSAIILSLASGTVTGGGGNDTLVGIENAIGSKYSDVLTGNAGDNVLSAEAGNDVLKGGGGADVLTGGRGADAFVLTKATDSVIGQEDVITDFQHDQNDRIDLRLLPGKFSFLGDGDFTGHANEVHYTTSGSDLFVSGDIDGDGHADFQIKLIGVAEIEAGDFFL